jgi:GH35 family endo-1,4-beta-xylanase
MKRTLIVFLLVNLILSACAPVSAPTPTPAPSATPLPTATTAPTSTATPTSTPTAIPTATPTPIPTIQVGSLSVPDPRVTNPELFDLRNPDAPIPQFVKAMKMAGIEITAEQVAQGMAFRVFRDLNGTPFVILTYKIDPDPQVQGDALEGEIPLVIGINENQRWQWNKATLRRLSELGGFTFGAFLGGNGEAVRFYNQIFDLQNEHFNLSGIWVGMTSLHPRENNFDPFSSFTKIEIQRSNRAGKRVLVHPVVWGQDIPSWVMAIKEKGQLWSAFREHVTTIADFISKTNIVDAPIVIVVNEANWNDFWYQRLGIEYVSEAFRIMRQHLPNAVLIYNDFDNHTRTGSRYQWTKQIISLLQSDGLIDGIGIEFIIDGANPPRPDDVIQAMKSYGMPIYVTEFNVLMGNVAGNRSQKLRRQAEIYYTLTKAALLSGVCKAFVDFQTGDRFSIWVQPDFAYGNPNNMPTPFDDNLNPKLAYYTQMRALIEVLFEK